MAAPTLLRFVLALAVALAFAAPLFSAAPARDDALRLAPPDAAFVVVVQNARDHLRNVAESPFAQWFPTSALGKQFLAGGELKQFRQVGEPLVTELGTSPEELLNDVLGEAVVFAYTPPAAGRAAEEQAVILIRPRKPETLTRLLDRVNALQTKSGELNAVVKRTHGGQPFFERQKAGGSS